MKMTFENLYVILRSNFSTLGLAQITTRRIWVGQGLVPRILQVAPSWSVAHHFWRPRYRGIAATLPHIRSIHESQCCLLLIHRASLECTRRRNPATTARWAFAVSLLPLVNMYIHIYEPVCVYVYMSIYVSIYLQSIYLSIYVCIYVSRYLGI